MGIPFRNTDFDNNPIGNDRPIYGNEKLPPSPTPTISLTPSITPSLTITPTPTPTIWDTECSYCLNTRLTAGVNNENPTTYKYADCSTKTWVYGSITAGQSIEFCWCNGTFGFGSSGTGDTATAVDLGPCSTPTPTPTISITPSITPSPTNCNCLEYEITNNSLEAQDTIGWLDCNQQYQEQTLDPGFTLRICACAGSVQSRGGLSSITLIGSCSITPTPTPTPTITPSPSSVYAWRYQVSNCDDALDVRVFWSDDFYALGKVVKGDDQDKCFEIVDSSTLTPTEEVQASFISCGSCPR